MTDTIRWLRLTQTALLASLALMVTVIVFTNLTDYGANFEFVRHVLMMDDTFQHPQVMWRAIQAPAVHHIFYFTIIAWEILIALLCWWGAARCWSARRSDPGTYHSRKNVAVAGLVVSLLLWLLAFLTIGGEWFVMWQSSSWNGQEAAFRMFAVTALIFLFLFLPEEPLRS